MARWFLLLTLIPTIATGAGDALEKRVGKTYWARPALSETSVEFYGDLALREREAVRVKTRFRVVAVKLGGPWPASDPIYEVRFDDGQHAFIDGRDFERRLYRELHPNEVATSPRFEPPLGQGVQVYQFDRASIFAADPDILAARVRNQGPRSFQPVQGGVPVPVPPAVVTPAEPAAPIIPPR
jgi:hypothetical protein